MPDKKLTDAEIVKALEDIVKACFKRGIFYDVIKAALSLINRLQEENERLKAKCENTQIGYNFAKDEIKNLKKDKYKLQKALNQSEDYRVIAKAEAYKECIEKVNNKIRFLENRGFSIHYVVKGTLNNLLKELVGENQCQE